MTFTADISITQCAPRGSCRSNFCTSCACVCVCITAKIRTSQFVTSAVFNDFKPINESKLTRAHTHTRTHAHTHTRTHAHTHTRTHAHTHTCTRAHTHTHTC